MDGPGLTAELCHEPAALRGDVGHWHENDGEPVVPSGQTCEALLVGGRLWDDAKGSQQSACHDGEERDIIGQQEQSAEEQDEQTSRTHHDAERPEVHGDKGHEFRLVTNISVTEMPSAIFT